MAWIRELQLRDVRCFEGVQSARLGRRITLLVGENSAGKSTFMGCYKALTRLANLDDIAEENHFDQAPFHMGDFDSVARSGRKEFVVGAAFEDHCHASASFTFRAQGNRPVDRVLDLSVSGTGDDGQSVRIVIPDEPEIVLRFGGPGFTYDMRQSEVSYRSIATWLSRYVRTGHLPYSGDLELFRKRTGESGYESGRDFVGLINFLGSYFPYPEPGTFVACALDPALPERARSYRVLPVQFSSRSEGILSDFLPRIGERLGLWRNIAFESVPNSTGTVVMVETTPGVWRNLIDVGYGIHGLLPLLVSMAGSSPDEVNLLQHPEVHVHPRAQATLAEWMAESGRRFMIETHSDHFVDRFRICVMKGLLSPEDLSIVYFQPDREGTHSCIHGIAVDRQGNLEGEPPDYRLFFLEESRDLLGIG